MAQQPYYEEAQRAFCTEICEHKPRANILKRLLSEGAYINGTHVL